MKSSNEKKYKKLQKILNGFKNKDDKGVSLLSYMLEHQDNDEIAVKLIEYGFENGLDQCLGMALQISQKIKELFNKQNSNGTTLYHVAMEYELPYTTVVAMTCCYPAPYIQDKNGDTFLHVAIKRGNKAVCENIAKMLIPNYRKFGPIWEGLKPEPFLAEDAVEIKNNAGKSVRELYKEIFGEELPSKEHSNGIATEEKHIT